MADSIRLSKQGEWTTAQGPAVCIEQEGFGIVGGLIDKTGEGYLLELLLAAPDLLAALQNLLAYANRYSDHMAEIGRGAEELGELADYALASVQRHWNPGEMPCYGTPKASTP